MSNVNPLSNQGNLISQELIKKDLNRQLRRSKTNPSQLGGDWCGCQHPQNQFFDDPRQAVGEHQDKPLARQSYWWGDQLPAPSAPKESDGTKGVAKAQAAFGQNDFYVAGIYRRIEKRRARSPRRLGEPTSLLTPKGTHEKIGPWAISGPKGQIAGWMAGNGPLGNPRPRDSWGQITRRDPEQLTKIGSDALEDFLRELRAGEPLEPAATRLNPSRVGELDSNQCWRRGPQGDADQDSSGPLQSSHLLSVGGKKESIRQSKSKRQGGQKCYGTPAPWE